MVFMILVFGQGKYVFDPGGAPILTNSHFAPAQGQIQEHPHYFQVLYLHSRLLLPREFRLTDQQSTIPYSRRSLSAFRCLDQAAYGQNAVLSNSLQSRHFRRPRNELVSEWCQH